MPRKRVREDIVYKFSELSETAKENARKKWGDELSYDTYWAECTIAEAVEQAGCMGITIARRREWTNGHGFKGSGSPCIYWSGFSSQGDGACFEGSWHASGVNADKVAYGWGECEATSEIKRIASVFAGIAKTYPDASFTVKHRDRYSNENCTEFCVTVLSDEEHERWALPTEAEAGLIEAAKDFMRWIYKQLNTAYDYYMSDEEIENNECEFTEDGTIA